MSPHLPVLCHCRRRPGPSPPPIPANNNNITKISRHSDVFPGLGTQHHPIFCGDGTVLLQTYPVWKRQATRGYRAFEIWLKMLNF